MINEIAYGNVHYYTVSVPRTPPWKMDHRDNREDRILIQWIKDNFPDIHDPERRVEFAEAVNFKKGETRYVWQTTFRTHEYQHAVAFMLRWCNDEIPSNETVA